MWKFLQFFSRYADPFERKVDRFFRSIKSSDNILKIREKLLALMQENLIVLNVWLEKKYKGYEYLKKSARRTMYENEAKIVAVFEAERSRAKISALDLKKVLADLGLTFPNGGEEELLYLAQIMSFLTPGKYYNYIRTASFGKLLRDPSQAKMEGDCNQIVTLYAYLFSLKFPLDHLQIKLLPEHVCLHFRGIDIEATNATFQKYAQHGQVLPITEIISTNLLDLADFREDVQKVSPREMVKSAQLACAISSLKSVVDHNLAVAYKNLAVSALNSLHFDTARYFADKSADPELIKTVRNNEAVYSFEHGNFERALMIFSELGDGQGEKACYQKQYNELAKKVAQVKTVEQARKYKSVYQKMLDLAGKIGNISLQSSVREILGKI